MSTGDWREDENVDGRRLLGRREKVAEAIQALVGRISWRSHGLLALFAWVTRLPLLAYPKACDDEQVYAVVAMEMLRGGRPYIDAVERKPPLLFYLYEGLFRLGGAYNY